jgi:hypothetical protein
MLSYNFHPCDEGSKIKNFRVPDCYKDTKWGWGWQIKVED